MSTIGILFIVAISMISIIEKSQIKYFSIEYNMESKSLTLNGIQAKKIKYCTMIMLIIFPNFVFRNLLLATDGNFFVMLFWIIRYAECKPPQITKFHDAPCQIPPIYITTAMLAKVLSLDFLLPPNGM